MNKTNIDSLDRNRYLYEIYKTNPDYYDVEFDEASGGMKATHKDHCFDPDKGNYEKIVQNVGFKCGHSVILEKEVHSIYKKRNTEGFWDGCKFEISGKETATDKNIREGLKHCAKKPGCKIAVLYFPQNNFNVKNFNSGMRLYNILHYDPNQWVKFDKVICIQDGKILYEESHIG